MLKKSITYVDFNGVNQTEDFYFNLTKSELAEMELATNGTFGDSLTKIVESGDGRAIIDEFKKIIFGAYGVKSDDGKRFIKSKELSTEFEQTAAYDVLFMELVTDADASAAFINGLVPQDFQQAPTQPAVTPQVAPPQPAVAQQHEALNVHPPVEPSLFTPEVQPAPQTIQTSYGSAQTFQ